MKKQRHISVRGTTYAKLKARAQAEGIHISKLVEPIILQGLPPVESKP